MFLNINGNNDTLFNENNYAVETLTNANPDFRNMIPHGDEGDLFTTSSRQAEVQWNVKISVKDCRDALISNIDGDLPDILPFSEIDHVMESAAYRFKCKIVQFFNNVERFQTFIPESNPTEAPLYMLCNRPGKSDSKLF